MALCINYLITYIPKWYIIAGDIIVVSTVKCLHNLINYLISNVFHCPYNNLINEFIRYTIIYAYLYDYKIFTGVILHIAILFISVVFI